MAAGACGLDGGEAPRRSLGDDATAALAAAGEDLASEKGARSGVGGAATRRRARSVVESAAAQLSIFDASNNSDSDNKLQRHP